MLLTMTLYCPQNRAHPEASVQGRGCGQCWGFALQTNLGVCLIMVSIMPLSQFFILLFLFFKDFIYF